MDKMSDDQQEREDDQHRLAEALGDLAENTTKRVPADIAGTDEKRGPKPGRDEVEDQEPPPIDAADPDRERRKIADPVDKTKAQNEPDIETPDPDECLVDAFLPGRLARQETDAEMTADPEIGLIAAETAEPGGDQ